MLLHSKVFGDAQREPVIRFGDIGRGGSFALCIGHPAPGVVAARVGVLRSLKTLAGSVVASAVPDLDRQYGPILRMDTDLTGTMIDSLRAGKLHTELRCRSMDGCVDEATDK